MHRASLPSVLALAIACGGGTSDDDGSGGSGDQADAGEAGEAGETGETHPLIPPTEMAIEVDGSIGDAVAPRLDVIYASNPTTGVPVWERTVASLAIPALPISLTLPPVEPDEVAVVFGGGVGVVAIALAYDDVDDSGGLTDDDPIVGYATSFPTWLHREGWTGEMGGWSTTSFTPHEGPPANSRELVQEPFQSTVTLAPVTLRPLLDVVGQHDSADLDGLADGLTAMSLEETALNMDERLFDIPLPALGETFTATLDGEPPIERLGGDGSLFSGYEGIVAYRDDDMSGSFEAEMDTVVGGVCVDDQRAAAVWWLVAPTSRDAFWFDYLRGWTVWGWSVVALDGRAEHLLGEMPVSLHTVALDSSECIEWL